MFTILILVFCWHMVEGGDTAAATSIVDTDDPDLLIEDAHPYGDADNPVDGKMRPTFPKQEPADVVDSIASRANDWHEPSARSEERYVVAIRQWLESLNPLQRDRARKILREAHPIMHDLRIAIRDKKMQLANLSFDRYTSPETLPRLGQELQDLRNALRGKLESIADRLKREVGVTLGPLGGDGFWLSPPDTPAENSMLPEAAPKLPHPARLRNNSHMDLYPEAMISQG